MWPIGERGHSVRSDPVRMLSRDDRIRTCDPFHPKEVRYRAALRPEHHVRLPNVPGVKIGGVHSREAVQQPAES